MSLFWISQKAVFVAPDIGGHTYGLPVIRTCPLYFAGGRGLGVVSAVAAGLLERSQQADIRPVLEALAGFQSSYP
jgi:hypothetical protein